MQYLTIEHQLLEIAGIKIARRSKCKFDIVAVVISVCTGYSLKLQLTRFNRTRLLNERAKEFFNTNKNENEKVFIYLVVQRFQQHALSLAPAHIRSYFVIFSIDHPYLVTSLWTHLIQYYLIKHYLFHSYRRHRLDWAMMRVICCCYMRIMHEKKADRKKTEPN